MKAFLSILLVCAGMCTVARAQTPLPTTGPSFSSRDSTMAQVISVASLQAYPVGIDRQSTRQELTTTVEIQETKIVAHPGPIRDWSNPPGYMGSRGPAVSSAKHKPLTPKKYHRSKSNRCYTF